MTTDNELTLRSYDEHVTDYVTGTAHAVSGYAKDWLDAALAGLPPHARIMEVGSAFGRDAAYIQDRGFRVECTDAAQGFLDHLRTHGFDARPFNVLTDTPDGSYDLIVANAVLLHFTPADFRAVLSKLAGALLPGGRLAFSLKQGDGEEWSSKKLNAPRYFCYWRPDALPQELRQAGFRDWTIAAVTTTRKHADWIYVIAQI